MNGVGVCRKHGADVRDRSARGLQRGFDLVARDKPAFQVSGVGGINFLHRSVWFAHFVDFGAHGCRKREEAFAQAPACSLRDEKSQAFDGAALGASPGPIQPQNSERENIFDGGGVFAGRGGQQGPRVRTFVHDAPNVGSGEGIFEIRGGGERIHDSVGKFFSEDARETSAELFASDASGGARGIGKQKFQAARFGAAEALNFQNDAVVSGLFDAKNAARQVALVGPEMHQRIFSFDAKFEMQRGEFGEPFAIFPDFHATGSGEVAERAIQGHPIGCGRIQRDTAKASFRGCRIENRAAAIAGYCRFRPVTRMEGYSRFHSVGTCSRVTWNGVLKPALRGGSP